MESVPPVNPSPHWPDANPPNSSRCPSCGLTWESSQFTSLSAFHSHVRQHQRICQDRLETDSDCSVHSSDRSDIEVSSGEDIPAIITTNRPPWKSKAAQTYQFEDDEEEEEEEDDDEMPQECDNCGREFDDEPHFKDHVLYCPKRYKCVLCPCPPLTWEVFQTHVLSHPPEEPDRKSGSHPRPNSRSTKRKATVVETSTVSKTSKTNPDSSELGESETECQPPATVNNLGYDSAVRCVQEDEATNVTNTKPSQVSDQPLEVKNPGQSSFGAQSKALADASKSKLTSVVSEPVNQLDLLGSISAQVHHGPPELARESYSFHGPMG